VRTAGTRGTGSGKKIRCLFSIKSRSFSVHRPQKFEKYLVFWIDYIQTENPYQKPAFNIGLRFATALSGGEKPSVSWSRWWRGEERGESLTKAAKEREYDERVRESD